MSQDVSTNQRTREPLTAPAPIQPWSAESDADKLMDELFSDIDRILEGGSKLPTEPVKPEYVSLQSLVIPQISMPPAVVSSQELVKQPSDEPTDATLVGSLETTVAPTTSSRPHQSRWSLDKLLLTIGLTSLVVTILLLLASHKKLTWPWSLNLATSSSAQNAKVSASDTQFVSYMLRSLEVIDNKTQAKQKTAAPSGATGSTNLPPVPGSANRTLAPNQPATVLERVYIPYYPPQMPTAPVAPPPAARFSVPGPSQVARPAIPGPSQVARPAIPGPSQAARPSLPVPSAVARPPVAVPSAARPSAPAPAPASSQAVAPPQAAIPNSPAASPPAPVANYTLVGLLELGERSAALFEINGITQRFNVGEAIGGSGWTLVSVANQEAVVRRNGEVRSIYVGQKF